MTLLNVGQPIGGIIQVAYTVPDIEKAVRSYAQDLKLGPGSCAGRSGRESLCIEEMPRSSN